jgi:hypothetical protein
MLVTVITPSNAAIFPEYIIPNIRHLVQDPEVLVRCTYAQCIVQLADTSVRYLEMGQALKAHGTFVLSPDTHDSENAHFEVRYSHVLLQCLCLIEGNRYHTMRACKNYRPTSKNTYPLYW